MLQDYLMCETINIQTYTSAKRGTQKGIKSISGQYFYNVDSLLLLLPDDTISADPIQMHDRLMEALVDHFICPQQDKYSSRHAKGEIDHQRLHSDKEYFKAMVS